MTLAELLEQYSTSLVAFAVGLACIVALALVRNRELRRTLTSTIGAMALFLGLRMLRALLTEGSDLAGWLQVAGLLVFAWGGLRLLSAVAFDVLPQRRGSRPTPKIVRQVIFGLVYAILMVAILRAVLKIDLASLLATSAVLSLVLGLALQDTLGNLFAGLSLQAEKPFEVGDWVTFGTFTGRIMNIGWRTTQIEDLRRDLVSVPNNVIARESVTNHSRPSPLTGVMLEIGLSYDAPPNKVRQAIQGVLSAEGRVLTAPEPTVRLLGYGDHSIQYRVRFWVEGFENYFDVLDAVNSKLWYRLRREGLEIPFPIRTVHLHQRDETHARQMEEQRRGKLLGWLARSEILAPLGTDGHRILAERGREITFGIGEPVFSAGDGGTTCYLLLSGVVQAEDEAGNMLARIEPGQIFGEGAVLTGEARTATVRAVRDTTALELDREAFREVLLANEQVAADLARILERRRADRPASAAAGEVAHRDRSGHDPGLLGRIRDIFGLGR